MKYQVGKINDLKENDPEFFFFTDAFIYALEQEANEGIFYGVWTDQESGSELRAIVYNGDVFSK